MRGWGGGLSRFSVEIFCLTEPKNFVEEPFCAVLQKISGSEKVYGSEEGEVSKFPFENFLSHMPKKIVGEPIRVSLIWVIEKFYAEEGYVTIFCRNFLSHSAEKFRRGTLLCCVSEIFRQRKSLWIRRGGVSRFSVENFLSHSAEKIRRGTL